MKRYIAIVILSIAVIVLTALLFRECSKEYPDTPQYSHTDTIIKTDTLTIKDTTYFPKPYEVIFHTHDTIKDTVELFNDYFAEKAYNLKYNDTLYDLGINILLERNALKSLDYGIDLFLPTTTVTNTIVKKEVFSVAAGGEIGFKFKSKMPLIAPEIDFSFNKHVIGGGYEFFGREAKLSYKYKFLVITK